MKYLHENLSMYHNNIYKYYTYTTSSHLPSSIVEHSAAQYILIAQKRKMKEEEKIKNTKVNALKRAVRMNQRAKSFMKLVANLPYDMMASEDPSTPLLLQVLLSLSTGIIKDSYQHLGGKMGELPDPKKLTSVAVIVRKWGERIWVMGSDACVS